MQASNRVRAALASGRRSLGMWQMVPGANVSRLLARSGVDWVCVDCEHGNIDGIPPLSLRVCTHLGGPAANMTLMPDGAMHDAVPAIAALGVSPIVRIPDMQGWMVKRRWQDLSIWFRRC